MTDTRGQACPLENTAGIAYVIVKRLYRLLPTASVALEINLLTALAFGARVSQRKPLLLWQEQK